MGARPGQGLRFRKRGFGEVLCCPPRPTQRGSALLRIGEAQAFSERQGGYALTLGAAVELHEERLDIDYIITPSWTR